jgi:hypothetical protein
MKKESLVYITLGIFITAGAVLVIGEKDDWWHLPVFGALGEALLIAGFLGLTVDRLIKIRLVSDIAEQAIRSIWGVGAPQEYLKSLNESLSGYKAITLHLDVEISLDWHDERKAAIRVTSTTRTVKQNISAKSWRPDVPWIAPSISGHPDSTMRRYELIIRRPTPGQQEIRRIWNERALEAQLNPRRTERITASSEFIARNRIEEVNTGDVCEARFEAVRYRYPDDMMPFWSSTPSLSWNIAVAGNAIEELDLECYAGASKVSLNREVDSAVYKGGCGFTHAGVALHVIWRPRIPEGLDPQRGNRRHGIRILNRRR